MITLHSFGRAASVVVHVCMALEKTVYIAKRLTDSQATAIDLLLHSMERRLVSIFDTMPLDLITMKNLGVLGIGTECTIVSCAL